MSNDSSHNRRVSDGWDRNEALVLDKLENLRISSDAALKGVNDLKMDLLRMESKFDTEKARVAAIDERISAWVKWGWGVIASIVVIVVKTIWDMLTQGGGSVPHK